MITIPTGTNSSIRIPAKAEKPGRKQSDDIEHIGVSIGTAAKMTGVSVSCILPLITKGTIRTVRMGKRVIVSVQSLRDFIDGKKEPCDSMENSVESQG